MSRPLAAILYGKLLPGAGQDEQDVLVEVKTVRDSLRSLGWRIREVPLDLGTVVQGVANNAYFNFPRLRGVYVFIHGQIPDLPGTDTANLAYAKGLVR